MDGKAICEVMIYSYAEFEKLCDLCDKIVYKKATKSMGQDAHKVYDVIRRYMNEKIAYCNSKVIIDDALNEMKRTDELKAFHFEGLSGEKIAERYGIEPMQAIARVQVQRKYLIEHILKKYSAEKLLDIICDSGILMSRYRKRITGAQQWN